MKVNSPKQFTRRKFIGTITLSSFLSLLIPTAYFFSLRNTKKKKISLTSRNLISGKFEFFTPYQATVIDEALSLIIPTDEDPGAKEAGVVFKLDGIVASSDKLKELYTKGIEWLDYMAERVFERESFLDLNHNEKVKILKIADSSGLSYIYKVFLFLRYRGTRTARGFFKTLKQQTIEVFYTSEMGWKVVGYDGPPQWSGNPDYNECSL